MKYLLNIILFLSFSNLFAQTNYDASKIAENLTKDAIAVIRNEEQCFEVKGLGSGQLDYKIAITVLNKAGDRMANFEEGYDKFSSIYNIKATLYDASGKKVRDYKSSDVKDQSMVSDFSIFEDNRVKYLKFSCNTYPYTVEYSFSKDYKGILHLPQWRDIGSFGVSVEQSAYTFKKNNTYKLRYITSENLKTDSTITGDKTQYKWSSKNVPAIIYEPYYTDIDNITSWVKIAPNQIDYDGSTGNFENWKNFGSWLYKLNENGNKLPEATKILIQNLVKDAKNPKDKIRVLYNYLQQNTRYVSVQLGIGGFRPILAEKVAQVNYGDCKALSNYMKALLNEAGIQSNLIVIGNDMPSLNPKYSSIGQANHMILCVPLEKDTVFLECTSQRMPMGFIGYSNSNRTVLMVTENGGQLVRTPIYNTKDNHQNRKTNISFSDDGTADISLKSIYSNAQFEDSYNMLYMEPVEQRKKIISGTSIPAAEVISFKYDQPDKKSPVLIEEINLKSKQLFTQGGDKIFLTINQINRRENVPLKIENRKTYFSTSQNYSDEDEIVYHLPKGYTIDFIPKDIAITSEFGSYAAKFTVKDNVITYVRTQNMYDKKYPPEKYNECVDFYKKIYQADKLKAVLTKTP